MAKKTNLENTFFGKESLIDFLDPAKSIPTPLVELPSELNPFYNKGVRIYAKLMNMLPLGNIKSLPAINMLREARKNNQLNNIKTLVENSSGNTVFSLAVIGRLLGVSKTEAFVSHEVSLGKLALLRLFGVDITVNEEPICPDPNDPTSGIYKAKRISESASYFNPGQYDNINNPRAHELWTGPQIWQQTKGQIKVLSVGLGTTGTAVGTTRYLKKKNASIKSIGVIRKPNNPVPGVRTKNLLNQIAFPWQKIVDEVEYVGTTEAYKFSLKLCRLGIVAGPSSGFALAGLLNYLKKIDKNKFLSSLKNKRGEIQTVFICPDSPLPYIQEYEKYLKPSLFPKIKNKHLLINKPGIEKEGKVVESEVNIEKSCKQVNAILNSKKINFKKILILDVRSSYEYSDHHIKGAIHIDYSSILKDQNKYINKFKNNIIFCVCAYGGKSLNIVNILRKGKLEAYSIKGGMTEWSNLDLPRWQPDFCIKK